MSTLKKSLLVLALLGLAATLYAQRVITQPGYSVLYDDAGRVLLVVANGSDPSLPVPPQEGALLYREDTTTLSQWSGGSWSSSLSVSTLTGDLTGDVTGSISGGTVDGTADGLLVTTTINTGTLALDADDCGNYFTNIGDTDGSTLTLPPAPPVGCTIRVMVVASQTITVNSAAGSENIFQVGDQCIADNVNSSTATHQAILTSVGAGGPWFDERSDFTCPDA